VNSKGLEQSAVQQRIDAQCTTHTTSEQTAMSNKSEIPPAVAEFALQQLPDQKLISRYEVTAENLEVLRARLACYEDEDGNPKAQLNTPVSAKDAPYMSDDTDPREAWADGYNAAVEEQVLSVGALREALQVWLADYEEWEADPTFEPHPHVAERVAKTRAALGVVDTGATEPHYTTHLDVRDLLKDAD
jgi:hypothetical protein